MYLQALKLTNFKNYESQTLLFSKHLNCFVGQNGMGKTNLLDAIYYLCMCKSHFKTSDKHIMKHEENFFRLEGNFVNKKEDERPKIDKIVAKVQRWKRKDFECNLAIYDRLSDHIGRFPVVMIAPDDTLMAMEGSEERRRFLDNTLCQLDNQYLTHLMHYNKVLSQRNKLLKQFAETRTFDKILVQSYDAQLLPSANYIHQKRQEWMTNFEPIFVDYYNQISGEREAVKCIYQSKLSETDFESLLNETLEKDRILQRTTTGIHKDDLKFVFNDVPVKQFASQGQLKSYILALKLAQYELLRQEKEMAPILLLDDIFDKLDESRVQHLLELLIQKKEFGQVFITDTHENRVTEIIEKFEVDFGKFIVKDGGIEEVEMKD
ncbi:MAG: DNA replication/repair protein RecF [Saprospiraceae bacterium]|nr:DNA replication/repair protein RecF [Saprospiraceae bacterium]